MRKLVALLIPMMASAAVCAAGIKHIDVHTEPTVMASAAGVDACGLNFTGISVDKFAPNKAAVVTGTVVMKNSLTYIVKAGYFQTEGNARVTQVGTKPLWLRIGSAPQMTPDQVGLIKGEGQAHWMFQSNAYDDMEPMKGMLTSAQLWIAFEPEKGGRDQTIFSGPINTSDETRRQVLACLEALAADLSRKIK